MGDRQHEIVADLKRVAIELGHSPSRREYQEHGQISERQIRNEFGAFSVAVTAAGLDPAVRPKKAKELFRVDIREHLRDFRAQKQAPTPVFPLNGPLAAIGDVHAPFTNLDTLTAIYQVIESGKPAVIIQGGDLFDMAAHSRFPRSLNTYSPEEELAMGLELVTEMWETLRRIAPQAICIQILGNHDVRPVKQALDKNPAGEIFSRLTFEACFQFEGVTTVMDSRQEVYIGDWAAFHGYKSKLGDHSTGMLMNTLNFHTHRGGVASKVIALPGGQQRLIHELNAGYCGDPHSKALGYTPQKFTGWTQGMGWIDHYGPRFIHL